MQRSVKALRPIENTPLKTLLFAVLGVLAMPHAVHAWTIDTGCVVDNTHTVPMTCTLMNLDPTKTATEFGNNDPAPNTYTSGLWQCGAWTGVTGLIPSGTIAPMTGASSTPATCPSTAGCRCHFEFKGISKGKARGTISSTVGTLEAH